MRAQRSVIVSMLPAGLVVFAVLAVLGGCGGSGSSGFDPAGLEPPLIEEAIATQSCVPGDSGLLICPSGASVSDPIGGVPSPGPDDLRVAAGFERSIDCDPLQVPACDLGVAIETEGLPGGAALRLAVRLVPEVRWRIGEPLAVGPSSGGTVVAPVEAQLAGDAGPGGELQIAVLVFVPPLGDVPAEVAELRETGARYAFVLAPMPVTGASR